MIPQGPRPPIPPRAECRDCAFPILFVKVGTSLIPVNPLPDDAGNVCAIRVAGVLVGYVISRSQPWDPRYMRLLPHAATCPAIDRPPKREPDEPLF